MSSTPSEQAFDNAALAIQFKWLLSIYVVVPIATLLVLVDLVAWQGELRRLLPNDPSTAFWYLLLFGLPHIIASELTFLRRDYLVRYRVLLLSSVVVCALTAILMTYFLDPIISYSLFAVFTMIHVVGQQVGLCRPHLTSSGWAFSAWKWSLISSACVALVSIGVRDMVGGLPSVLVVTAMTIVLISNLFFVLVLRDLRDSNARAVGFWYCLSTHAMVVVAVLCFATGYTFFAVLLPRVVHDITAFVFYTVHEHNQSKAAQKPLTERRKIWQFSVFLVLPLIAIGLAQVGYHFVAPVIILTIILIHYVVESRIWRHSSPHRRFVSFS